MVLERIANPSLGESRVLSSSLSRTAKHMTLVIFGYVRHFHIMQLAYRHALTAFDNISKVVIIWDDYHSPEELQLDQYLQREIDCELVKTSSLNFINEREGWLRQQFVKLNMHQIIDDSEFILLDGDCILREHKLLRNSNGLVINYYPPYENYKPYFDTIEQFLGLTRTDTQSFMSPYWLCERDVLIALQQYRPMLIQDFQQYRKQTMTWPAPFSECETYGQFAVQCQGQQFDHRHWGLLEVDPDKFVDLYLTTNESLVLGGRDNFPEQFWNDHGIKYNKDLNQWLDHN